MVKLLSFLFVFLFLTFGYSSNITKENSQSICSSQNLYLNQQSKTEYARRGCCSHHGGVCGCSSSGRLQCCDGTLSPTCGCYKPDYSGSNYIKS